MADLVLVTHRHDDHFDLSLVELSPLGQVITDLEAMTNGTYNSFHVHQIVVRAVPAFNDSHDPRETVGYILTIDGVKLYAAGDTSETDAMGAMIGSDTGGHLRRAHRRHAFHPRAHQAGRTV